MRKFIKYFSFLSLGMLWLFLMNSESARPYGWILFGIWFCIPAFEGMKRRIAFDASKKDIVSGTLVKLEKTIDGEGAISYSPYYEYDYRGSTHLYQSNFSAYWYKKTKKLGEKVELFIRIDQPDQIRINSKRLTRFEYFGYSMFLFFGLFFVLFGILSLIFS